MEANTQEALAHMCSYLLRQETDCDGPTAAQAMTYAVEQTTTNVKEQVQAVTAIGKRVLEITTKNMSDGERDLLHEITGGRFK